MRLRDTSIPGLFLVESEPHHDQRGFFVRVMDASIWRDAGVDPGEFVQDNQSRSVKGTIRGIHVRGGQGERKVVRCARGAMWDVIVDLRPASPTFRRWEAFELDDRNHRQLVIPPGCGHAFLAVTDVDTVYRHSAYYDAASEIAVAWKDPALAIAWPVDGEPIMSERDRNAPPLAALSAEFERWWG